jgi:hypothetical protein
MAPERPCGKHGTTRFGTGTMAPEMPCGKHGTTRFGTGTMAPERVRGIEKEPGPAG